MKQKLYVLLSICLTLVALLLLAVPMRAADAVVGSGTPGSCTETAFNTALNTVQSSSGGQITFNCGAAAHTITFSAYKEISSNVTIVGAGKITLDGNNNAAFFQVFNGVSLTLKQITMRRGIFSGSHALENFGTLTLEGVTVTQNVSTESAIANFGTLTIRDSTFSGNQLTGAGNGGVLNNDNGSVQIEGSTFTNNIVPGVSGAGGAISNQNGTINIVDSTFIGNAGPNGGAIYLAAGAAVTVTQSIFKTNVAGGDGGAIWLLGGDLDVDQTEFVNNKAGTTGGAIRCDDDSLSVTNSSFGNNESVGDGGAVYSTCIVAMTNDTFSENKVTGPSGGGGAIHQAGNDAGSVTYATIADNTANFGAGIYNDGSGSSSLTISKSLLANNTTGNCDGVITSGGYNLASDTNCAAFTQTGDQQNVALSLGSFGNYGGPTSTRPPVADSPALDAIPTAQCGISVDQRGVTRPQDSGCDIGAVEGAALRQVYLPLVIK